MKFNIFRSSVPRRALALATGGLCILSGAFTASAGQTSAAQSFPDILPLSRVKQGMVGYGLTTFHANTISRFDIKVIGIIKNTNVGRDLILIKMHGGPITERGA